MNVGILALQGDFREHEEVLQRIGVPTRQVRLPEHLHDVDRLIIPGGESTAIGKLLLKYNLLVPIQQRAGADLAVWGTCAGAILMARRIADGLAGGQPQLAIMDMTVRRNAFGRQLDSFEQSLNLPVLGEQPFQGIFIRAPRIEAVDACVEILGQLADGSIVAARQGRMLTTTFHPELTRDDRLHRYFLEL